jgi:SnoaL-like domain
MAQKLSERNEKSDSPAVAVARAHVKAWGNHDWDEARKFLAEDVHVTVSTTQPIMAATDTTGADIYMEGLIKFAQNILPESVNVTDSIGDEHNAMLMVTVKTAIFPGKPPVTLPGARLYQIDEKGKINAEKVIFCVLEN